MALFGKLFNFLGGKSEEKSAAALNWAELEQSLIEADLGPTLTAKILEAARKDRSEAEEAVMKVLRESLSDTDRAVVQLPERPVTILVVGVNGTGKTTSTAKLAAILKKSGAKVTLAAADTFRAAATEQLQTWGERLGITVVAGKQNGDPAAVSFDAITQAKAHNSNFLIVDTAGRLHTKQGLMDELGKIKRVIEKSSPVDEVLLVMDATTGQNGIAQAKTFMESVSITGLILTKMDGSAKGGIALAIESETGVPIKFIGTGEGIDDFAPFETESFLNGLIS
jgi:fused signal recognition particle receptor